MLAERNELALQIGVLSMLHPDWTMSEIATQMGWAPLFLINAFDEGAAMELFKTDREADTIELISEHPLSGQDTIYSMGTEVGRLADEILYAIANANKQEQDVSLEQLQWSWLKGMPKAHLELAVECLRYAGVIDSYKLSDPYDDKSEYTFLTLVSALGNEWGKKQFKPRSKANKKRVAKERGGE